MIQRTAINYYNITANGHRMYCGELLSLNTYKGAASVNIGLFKILYRYNRPLHAYAITKLK